MEHGFIKLHRKILENPIFRSPELLQLFIYFCIRANHAENEFLFNGEVMKLKRGQFVTGRFEIQKATGQKLSSIYKRLLFLEKEGYIKTESNNKFTLITVCKYELYNSKKEGEEQQNYAFVQDEFKPIFTRWLEFKKKKRQTYKNEDSLKTCYNHLIEYSNGSPALALAIVEKSIANNWAGIFPLNGKSFNKPINNNYENKQQFSAEDI